MAEIKKTSAPVDVYDLQYLVQTNRKNLGPYTSSAQSVYTVYQKLKNAMIWVEAYDDDAKGTQRYSNNCKFKVR